MGEKYSDISVGDILFIASEPYIVALVSDPGRQLGVTLISLKGGNRWADSVPVDHAPLAGSGFHLTQAQVEKLTDGDSYERAKKGDYSITIQYYAVVRTIKTVEVK